MELSLFLPYQLKAVLLWTLVIYFSLRLHKKNISAGKYMAISGIFSLVLAVFDVLVYYQVLYFTIYAYVLYIITYKGGTYDPNTTKYEVDPEMKIHFRKKKK